MFSRRDCRRYVALNKPFDNGALMITLRTLDGAEK